MAERCAVRNKFFGFVYAMNYIAQAAWSFVFPTGLIVGLGWFLRWRFDLGKWVMVTAIVFGVLCGVYSMFCYIIRMVDVVGRMSGDKDDRQKNRNSRK